MAKRRQKKEERNKDSEEIRKLNKIIIKETRKDIRKFNTEMIKLPRIESMKVLRRNMSIEKREIFKLRDKNSNIISKSQQILKLLEDFYKELYRNR